MIRNRIEQAFVAGLGGAIGIFLLSTLSSSGGALLLMAPFGASCVLLFSVPESPLSQPLNVVAGHLVSSSVGVLISMFGEANTMTLALSVALAIGLMMFLKVTHPPAGADPIVILLEDKGASFLIFPVLSGSIILVLIACLFHHFFSSKKYPFQNRDSV